MTPWPSPPGNDHGDSIRPVAAPIDPVGPISVEDRLPSEPHPSLCLRPMMSAAGENLLRIMFVFKGEEVPDPPHPLSAKDDLEAVLGMGTAMNALMRLGESWR